MRHVRVGQIPCGRTALVQYSGRLKPGVVVHAAHGHVENAGPSAAAFPQATAACGAKSEANAVTTISGGLVFACLAFDFHVFFLKKRVARMACTGDSLAVLAVALGHTKRWCRDGIVHGAALAATAGKEFVGHPLNLAGVSDYLVIARSEE